MHYFYVIPFQFFLRRVRKIVKSDYKLRHVRQSVRMQQLSSHWTDFHEILYLSIIRQSVEKFQVSLNLTRITGALHEDQYTFFIISRSILLGMKNVSDKISITFFENCAFYEIMWKYVVEWGRPQMAIWRTRIACWIPKATNTHTNCAVLIAFPLQQWLHERASILR
jgi:hypothetical protein